MWRVEAIPTTGSIKKLTARFPGLSQSIAIFTTYLGWSAVFRFVSVTFVTYFVLSSGGAENSKFEDVNEALSASQLALLAVCATCYVVLLRLFQPYAKESAEALVSRQRAKTSFAPGFIHGAVLAAGVTLAFFLAGAYRYLGFFIQAERAPLALAGLMIRVLATLAFVYFEEYIFRQRILRCLIRRGEFEERSAAAEFWRNLSAVAFTAILYVGMKLYQFDLGWMQALTLYLIALALGTRALSRGDFALGAGFWSAILIVFQVLLSLPILGNDFSGLLLVKYQSIAPSAPAHFLAPESSYGETLRFITGGAGGPLASFALQLLILFDILRGTLRYRRRLERFSR